MTFLIRDFTYGVRMLKKQPMSIVMAVTALALGIGLVTTMVMISDQILLTPPPYKEESRMYLVQWETSDPNQFSGLRPYDWFDFSENQTSFDSIAALNIRSFKLSRDDIATESIPGVESTYGFIEMGGVQPFMGRGITPEDCAIGAEPVVIIGYSVWQNNLNGAVDILGQTVRVDGVQATIIGVMPEGYGYPVMEKLWRPYILDPAEEVRGSTGDHVRVIGTLRDGLTLDQAKAEFDSIAQRFAVEYPDTNRDKVSVEFQDMQTLVYGSNTRPIFLTMTAAVFLVLIVACANVANIIFGRSTLRLHELAIRTALGATRPRLVKQMLVETLIIAVLGAVLGFLLAQWALTLLNRTLPSEFLPYWWETGMRPRILLEIVGITVLATLMSGIMPAIKATGVSIREALADSTRTASSFSVGRISRFLVVLQVALSCGLVIGALFMIKFTSKAIEINFPFDPNQVLTASILTDSQTDEAGIETYQFLERLQTRMEEHPDVNGVAFTSAPGLLYPWRSRFRIDGQPYQSAEDAHFAYNEVVSEAYFDALGLSLLQGRLFERMDTPDTRRVVVINNVYAESHWPGEDPIGKRIRDIWDDNFPWMTVVGVVTDMGRPQNEFTLTTGCVYQFMGQAPQRASAIVIRTDTEPIALAPFVREQVRALDPEISVEDFYTVQGMADRSAAGLIFLTSLFATFGIVAVFLSAVGVYGVVSASVAQRAREIGVRLALGATANGILMMLFRQGILQITIGLLLGVGLGWTLNTVLAVSFDLVGGNLVPVWTYLLVPTVLLAVAAGALAVPSLRAARISPMTAIREE